MLKTPPSIHRRLLTTKGGRGDGIDLLAAAMGSAESGLAKLTGGRRIQRL